MFDMRRRSFITLLGGAAATWPVGARGQQTERMRRVGVLVGLAEADPDTKSRLAAFQQGLERLGWSEGRNVRIDYRFAPPGSQLQTLARELVSLQPDVILSQASPATRALQRETRTIPIVFVGVADPIGSGFVSTLAQPGGNITGFLLFEASITGKWLAMLKDIAAGLTRATLVINPKTAAYYEFYLQAAEAALPHSASSLYLDRLRMRLPILSVRTRHSQVRRTVACFFHRIPTRAFTGIFSSRLRRGIACPRSTLTVSSSPPVVSCATAPTVSSSFNRRRPTSTAFYAVARLLTCRCRCRPSTKPLST
jgi:hypothetical protein